ncbi:MAG: isoprenylcysteine carboxylmethyltransferase family protein [Candidatus Aminicenantales bacterium]
MNDSNRNGKRHKDKPHGCPGEHPYGDRGQVIIFFVFLVVWVLDSFVLKWTTILAAFVPLPVRLGLAVLVLILAVYFVQTGHRVISDPSFSDKGLKKDGPFARLRHPLYGGSVLFYLSLVISTLSLAAFVVWCVIVVFYNFIAAYEERYLLKKYGEEYQEYQRKVLRWFPRLRPARFN